jgi:predicted protein tyrosine phosphatase
MGAAIADLGHVVETEATGRNLAVNTHANFLERKKTALVIERVHKRAIDRSLKPGSLMESRVVVAYRRVIAPDRKIEIIVLLVL